jgi:hypothetical protein
MKGKIASFLIFYLFVFACNALAADIESRLNALEETIKQQGETIKEQQRIISELREQLRGPQKEGLAKAEEQATFGETSQKATGLFGSSVLTNPYISLVLNTFAYNSNLGQEELEIRNIPGYTNAGIESRKGFNLEAAELFLFAPVDPYFNLYATIPVTEDGAELEEAYFLTTSLPCGFQLKGGKFKSGFGRINSQHPHAWDFVDIPLVYKAFSGPEGITEKGGQLTYLPPLPFYTLLGTEVLQGENDVLFGSDAKPGPHAYTLFAKTSFDLTDNSTILFGPSVMTGKTKTGSVADDTEFRGTSTLYGLEFTYKWKPSKTRGLAVQTEYQYRRQSGDLEDDVALTTEALKRAQDGLYIQTIYQIERWRAGARYDVLGLFKDDYILSGTDQDFGERPWRASGMLEFNPTEFSRIRLQYNYDKSARVGKTNQELFLQFVFGIGAHGAHPF